MPVIGFVGTGNMGGALARAAAAEKSNSLLLANRTPAKAQALADEIGGSVTDNAGVISTADYIFIGVKPQMLHGLAANCADEFRKRGEGFVIVSMAAGSSIELIQSLFGAFPVIRIMPNTPASIGLGMILYACSKEVSAEQEQGFLNAMKGAGRFMKIEEKLIDAGSAVSGCGPAFADLFIEALADGGVACGLPRKQAMEMAAQMLLGSAALVLQSGKHPGELKDAVCSPGGSTIQGVRKLEEHGFRSAVFEAVVAAYEKNKSLV